MAPPSKQTVLRVYFDIGLNLFPGVMATSLDALQDKVSMELIPAGVFIVSARGSVIVPYARCKSINVE